MTEKKRFTIKWDITYEKNGESLTWKAVGWDSINNEQHNMSGMSTYPYWFNTMEEARNNAMSELDEYTTYKRFRYENKESVTL